MPSPDDEDDPSLFDSLDFDSWDFDSLDFDSLDLVPSDESDDPELSDELDESESCDPSEDELCEEWCVPLPESLRLSFL